MVEITSVLSGNLHLFDLVFNFGFINLEKINNLPPKEEYSQQTSYVVYLVYLHARQTFAAVDCKQFCSSIFLWRDLSDTPLKLEGKV